MCKWTIPLEQHIAGVTKGTLKIPTKAKVRISNYSGKSYKLQRKSFRYLARLEKSLILI